ncbi:MAG: single-stranded-DNA-specific exonuclease RecJ [Kiritimatiellae bacterium]|nr:single-stranded-DNA-specific exonuclease RecJ [Kiritimatiellia bacterium]
MSEIPQLVERILELRGISAEEVDEFLSPSIRDLAPPCELPNVDAAAETILAAVRAKRKIVVFGDYDCDGVCATAILVRALSAFGADVSAFLPERLSEGYGMSEASVSRMLKENPGVGLVVTVDNGINSVENVAFLKEKGVDVVVTDHHLPGDTLPDCVVVNPKVSHPEIFENLCGAGVAFLLANELVTKARAQGLYSGQSLGGPLLVLAGLATVTDVMPLLGQNRILVAEALNRFDTLAPVGLRSLFSKAARRGVVRHTSKDFGFLLGPRINAAGRIASGAEALRLVLANNQDEADEAARIVNGRNDERKNVEQKMLECALAQVVQGAAAQVIDLPEGHQGVAGIVAARVMERMEPKVPVCVVVGGHGSARAPDGINVRDALAASGEFLNRFGGHAAAAGFSVKDGMVDAFRERFAEVCAGLSAAAGDEEHGDGVDAWVSPDDLTIDLAEWLTRLEPFGEGNPEPVFGMKGAVLSDIRPLGADGRHLALTVNGMRSVWWGRGDLVEELRRNSSASRDVVFTIEESDYGGPHVELRIAEIR